LVKQERWHITYGETMEDCVEVKPATDVSDAGEKGEQQKD